MLVEKPIRQIEKPIKQILIDSPEFLDIDDAEIRRVYHTCKVRTCPSCGYRAILQWQLEQEADLPNIPYSGEIDYERVKADTQAIYQAENRKRTRVTQYLE